MVKIGDIELDVPFFQAPLSGYTDYAMRKLAFEMGCPLTFTGVMLDAVAVHPKAVRKLKFQPGSDEKPVGAQVMGSTPEVMAQASAAFEKMGYDLIDLNFACPVQKVLRRGRGGHMLTKPDIAIEVFKQVRDAVKCPVTVKLRICFGYNDGTSENFLQICEGLSNAGVDGIAVHGRSVKGMYRGKADWETIKAVKEKFPAVKIFGSGDIMDAQTVVDRIEETGVDGIVIARGAIGNPWIFREARALFEGKAMPEPPSIEEQGIMMLRHFEMLLNMNPERKSVPYFRKFSARYTKRHPQRKKVLMDLLRPKTRKGIHDAIRRWYGVGIEDVDPESISVNLRS